MSSTLACTRPAAPAVRPPSRLARALDGLLLGAVGLFVRLAYRLRREHLHHVPRHGACLLVCNHVSFIDALLVAVAVGRPVRFVMDRRLYFAPILHPLMRLCGVIPIAPAHEDPQLLARAWDRIDARLQAGEAVGIFPEGRITDHGELYPFRRGVERILERTPVPVIPLAIRGMWGSFFSRRHGPAMRGRPRRGRQVVTVVAGPALDPATATAARLQDLVAGLRGPVG